MVLMLQQPVEERLRDEEILWLTTVRPDGRPHSVPVWFLWENAQVLILSRPGTQKIRNLHGNRFVTLALDHAEKGVVILEGSAELPEEKADSATMQTYGEKYRAGLRKIGVSAEDFGKLYARSILITPLRLLPMP